MKSAKLKFPESRQRRTEVDADKVVQQAKGANATGPADTPGTSGMVGPSVVEVLPYRNSDERKQQYSEPKQPVRAKGLSHGKRNFVISTGQRKPMISSVENEQGTQATDFGKMLKPAGTFDREARKSKNKRRADQDEPEKQTVDQKVKAQPYRNSNEREKQYIDPKQPVKVLPDRTPDEHEKHVDPKQPVKAQPYRNSNEREKQYIDPKQPVKAQPYRNANERKSKPYIDHKQSVRPKGLNHGKRNFVIPTGQSKPMMNKVEKEQGSPATDFRKMLKPTGTFDREASKSEKKQRADQDDLEKLTVGQKHQLFSKKAD